MKENDRIGILEAQMAEIRTLLGLAGPRAKPTARKKIPSTVNAVAARKGKPTARAGKATKGSVYSAETRAVMVARMRGRKGASVPDLSRETGISRATLWKWKRADEGS
jgi:hypothetical protein